MGRQRFSTLLPALLLAVMVIVPCASAYQASSYGNTYTNLDTNEAARVAANELASMGYTSTAHTGRPGAADARTRMANDNVFFFDGHAAPGMLEFSDGSSSIMTAKTSSTYPHLENSNGELTDIVLAMFMGCNSANSDSSNGNLVTQAQTEGIDMSVGWTSSFDAGEARYWSDRFWYWLDEGCSVKIAIRRATSDTRDRVYPNDLTGVQNVQCNGNNWCSMTIDPARAGN